MTRTGATSARETSARELARRRADERGPLLEVLHDVQRADGCISDAAVVEIADELNLSVAEVHGVVSFYDDLRRTPPPAHTVRVCRGEACQAVGAEELHGEVERGLAGRADVEVRQVFCFGNCALGPSVTVDGELRGRATAAQVLERAQGWDG
ncbi:NAD(P)H-dependent oxidoreductase subunit E [Ornithinimicrobium sp. LYQ103]|uniref:NADH-quinone oxidoreductase subunit NuoE family protein n=1 Tax=Ornithinimicrobium sp. LYQ103 TaxID=3378796 RepID=UPI0038547759